VRGIFVGLVAQGLQLEGGVFNAHVEVGCDAFLQLVEELWCVAVAEALGVDDDVGGQHRQAGGDLAGVEVVDGTDVVEFKNVRPHRVKVEALRRRFQKRGRIRIPMRIAATASAPAQPVNRMTTAAPITATEPNASFTTSRNAARRLKFAERLVARTRIDATFPTRPMMPKTRSWLGASSGGLKRR
jgi:hypothetical protein